MKLSRKDLTLITLMLFSLFFGAGNLIFPPFLGQSAGENAWISLAGFFITAVGFPILGVIAVAKSGGLKNLSSKVNPIFASIFTVLIYLSIGPCLGIPRAGSLPFEMAVAPYLSENMSVPVIRFIFTFIFFGVAFWLALTPAKLVNRMGKVLTPILLTLISVIFLSSIFKPLGSYGEATGNYLTSPLVEGFLQGYLTMDTIAALNFGIVISMAIKSKGVKEESDVIKTSIKAGIGAGSLLIIVYSMLCHLGAGSGGTFGTTENGAQTLTNVVTYIFGSNGAFLLAVVFTLACLTTSIGLITSCSEYFSSLSNKVSYKTWVTILALSSMLLANMGLTKILSISVPVLNAIYPIAIMLIVLAFLEIFFNITNLIYGITILFTGVVSVSSAILDLGVDFGGVLNILSKLPLYSEGLPWVCPAVLGIIVGSVLEVIRVSKTQVE